jgi:hypothetical protein
MSEVVRYAVDDGSVVSFEIDPVAGYVEASPDRVVGRVRQAVGPAVKAAREVLDQVTPYGPQEVEVKVGVKVTGTMDWLVARAATEGNFEVTLTWRRGAAGSGEVEATGA